MALAAIKMIQYELYLVFKLTVVSHRGASEEAIPEGQIYDEMGMVVSRDSQYKFDESGSRTTGNEVAGALIKRFEYNTSERIYVEITAHIWLYKRDTSRCT